MILIAYWDLSNPIKSGYKQFPHHSDTHILKPGILPGAYGFPDLYIQHLSFVYRGEEGLIIAQTERELDESDRARIVQGAINFLTPPDEPA